VLVITSCSHVVPKPDESQLSSIFQYTENARGK
jgi:hypothetical protein